jgi:hypothetical protein
MSSCELPCPLKPSSSSTCMFYHNMVAFDPWQQLLSFIVVVG